MLIDLMTLVILPLLSVSALLCGWRVFSGPSLADRALGLEMLTTLSIGVAACLAVVTGQPVLLDVAVVLALVAFLGALAFARGMRISP